MQKHSAKSLPQKKSKRSKPVSSRLASAPDPSSFAKSILNRISPEDLEEVGSGRKHNAGRPVHLLSSADLLIALLFHFSRQLGSLAESLHLLLGFKMAESSLSQRRMALPAAVFEELLRRILKPVGLESKHPTAFYKGLRLVGIDGVSFSLPNNAETRAKGRKYKNQHGVGAFFKLNAVVLLELVMHNPLGVVVGLQSESEWALGKKLVSMIPKNCLLIADRLYGCGAFVWELMPRLKEVGGRFLLRIRDSIAVRNIIRRLSDGSQIIEVAAMLPGDHHKEAGRMQVRQIRGTVSRRGFRTLSIRLWTDLLDEKAYPAQELIALYAQRWEQETAYRELKYEMGINDLLKSQTIETAAQEVAGMFIVSSLVAEQRAELKTGTFPVTRISMLKTMDLLRPMWLTLALCGDLLSEKQKQGIVDRFLKQISMRRMAKKRHRSCPRVMCQPAQPWPRRRKQKDVHGQIAIRVDTAKP